MKSMKFFAAIILVFFLMTGSVLAKDLQGKLGVGFNSQLTARGVESISAKYWMNDDIGFQGAFGFYSGDDYDEMNLGGKILFKIQDETNLHVDAFGGVGYVSYDPDPGDSDSGLAIAGGLSIEYFFSGLPNLGFSTEIGLTFSDIGDDSALSTSSDTFITAGIHYYFNLMAPSAKEPIQ